MRKPFRRSPSEYEQFIEQGRSPTHDPIKLTDGLPLRISQLFYSETYAGLLAGKPNADLNQELIDDILSYAKDKIWAATEPTLIPPVMREPVIIKRDQKKYVVLEQPQYLPWVTCIAQIESPSPARDKTKFGSMLTVVWFQDRYPFPIDPYVVDCISKLDWNTLAVDYEP